MEAVTLEIFAKLLEPETTPAKLPTLGEAVLMVTPFKNKLLILAVPPTLANKPTPVPLLEVMIKLDMV